MIQFHYGSLFALFFTLVVFCNTTELSTTILQVSDGDTVNISLSKYNKTINEDQVFSQLINVNNKTMFAIVVNSIPAEVNFLIIQYHSHIYNVSMSYDYTSDKKASGNIIVGTNIGLYVKTTGASNVAVYASNQNNFTITGLVAVVAYTNDAPSPGGCNMEFDMEKSPFQKCVYDEATITVDAQPAGLPSIGGVELPCEKYFLVHDAYRMYMPGQDFSKETYFLAIAKMLTVRDIEANANFIPASLYGSIMRRVFSVYPGVGSVHAMVARFGNHSAAYVPIVTYGCDNSLWSNSCTKLTTSLAKVLCASAFFIGLFLTMRGQYYFKTSMFLIGMIFGGSIGYTIGTGIGTLDVTGIIIAALITGTATSLLWLVLWTTHSSPIPSLLLSGLTFGTFAFCLFYYTIPVEFLYLEVDAYYYFIFTTFIILAILIFSVIPLTGNILCFTTLGAYATVFSIDHYSNANLKYIIINAIRRATVSNFNVAVIQPPYQDTELLFTIFWTVLLALGLYKQCATNWNRAPFPPSAPFLVRDSENAPLLGGQRYRSRHRSFNNQRFRYDNSSELRF